MAAVLAIISPKEPAVLGSTLSASRWLRLVRCRAGGFCSYLGELFFAQ